MDNAKADQSAECARASEEIRQFLLIWLNDLLEQLGPEEAGDNEAYQRALAEYRARIHNDGGERPR